MDTSQRSEALAEYFEQIGWKVRFADLVPEREVKINEELPISMAPFLLLEFRRVLKKFKNGKAAGHDDIAPDFWKPAPEGYSEHSGRHW